METEKGITWPNFSMESVGEMFHFRLGVFLPSVTPGHPNRNSEDRDDTFYY